jgi:hypothetical protein
MNWFNKIWITIKKWCGCQEKIPEITYSQASWAMLNNLYHHINVSERKFSDFDNYKAIINKVIIFEKKDESCH